MGIAMDGLHQVFQELARDHDLAWITREIEGVDALTRLELAVASDRQVSLEMYRRGKVKELFVRSMLTSLLGGAPDHGYDIPRLEPWVYPLVAGHDAARFVQLSAEVLGRLDGSLADTWRATDNLHERWGDPPWHAPTAPYVASLLTLGVSACVDLESTLRLARIGLADHERGRAAALELLEHSLDPANDREIGRHDQDDGSVELWCVGSDAEGDIVWRLPPRR